MYTCLLLNHCLMIQQEFLALYKNTSKKKKKPIIYMQTLHKTLWNNSKST